MKKISILLLMTVVILACEDDHESVPFDDTYFPLHVGDYWEFTFQGQYPPVSAMKKEITKTVIIKGRKYYLMTSQYTNATVFHIDTTYYRVDGSGYVYSLRDNWEAYPLAWETNPFQLAAPDGASWKYATNLSSEGKMTLHQFTTVQLDRTAVDSCKLFSYNVEQWVDEEYYITLGPGLGIVSQGSYAWGNRYDLKKAVINGRTFEF